MLGGSVEDSRVTLGRKTVLVGITADAGNTLQSEIKEQSFETSTLEEGNQERTQTAVDVEPDVLAKGELGQSRDVVDDTVGEVGSRADQYDRVGVDQTSNSVDVNLVLGSWACDEVKLDLEVLSSLTESSVAGLGENPIMNGQY